MNRFVYESENEEATARLGAALAEVLPDGAVVALRGDLGSGKTRLTQAVADALGIDRREVLSPTFVLLQEHHGRRSLYHFDVYRIRDLDEFEALGPEEYFDRGGLVMIEWADRVAAGLPPKRIEIQIEITGPDSRRFEIFAIGRLYGDAIERLISIVT
ncbi:MAG: tRNA (adenosine(37)-N6)-threonylcarbamoyltransferase complex ATPase subunit type 1 TsaE [Pirellulaceae bacterium]|nr:tRNA (adenosine(37)-N6)-threonylcarbamoyltransferase complex ATPase subunit type 1 TsaE [Pirellulaceae bacterium]